MYDTQTDKNKKYPYIDHKLQKDIENSSFTTSNTETINISEHILEEEPLNFLIEKNCVDTYYYDKKENYKNDKCIELKNYLLSDVVSTNNLYKELQEKVLKESESIHDPPKRNYSLEYRELENKKQFFFERKRNYWEESIKGLNELLHEINHIIKELQVNKHEVKEIQKFVYLYNSTKLTLATTYLYNKKYEMGKRLVDELINEHPYYLRPYIKKLEFFHTRGELDNARELYDRLESRKNELTEEKDKVYFKQVSQAFLKDWEPYQRKKEEQMKTSFSGFGKKGYQEESEDKSKKVHEEIKSKKEELKQKEQKDIIKEKPSEDQQVAKQNEHYLWLKALFGGLLFLGSSVSIYLLFRYRKKFMVSKH